MLDRHTPVVREIAARGVIKSGDVERLRQDFLAGGVADETGAEALFALDRACAVQDIEFQALFIEALAGYVVSGVEPIGYVTAQKARWLVDRAAPEGRLERLSCLELLVRVLEISRWSPPSLAACVLRQIEKDISTGKGPLRTAATTGRGRVSKAAADYMRRVLAATNRSNGAAISRAEAEVLLDIHDATITAENCLQWTELFTKAMADLLMTASGYVGLDRAALLQPEPWLDASVGANGFVAAMNARGFEAVLETYKPRTSEDRALAHLEHHKVEIITAEPIDEIDAGWLARRLAKAPQLTAASKALLSYLRTQDRALHPAFRPLLERAA